VIVLGIDPGLSVTGYGVVEGCDGHLRLVEAGILDAGDEHVSIEQRLCALYLGITQVLEQHHPAAVAMEQLYAHYAHPRTAILMGHARGVLCLAAGLHDIPLFDYPPTEVKASLTGNGHASKEQIQRVVQHTFGISLAPTPPDVADAVAVALCHLYRTMMLR
jgi:crossover junction endodeoxyribonuclease RuvC